MARAYLSKRYLALIATLIIPFAVSACYAVFVHAKSNTRLQKVADNAALAGVNSLAASIGQPADARSAAAIAAARTFIAAQSGVILKMRPSVDALTMAVVVEDKGTQVSATARYIPAKDGQPARQAANLAGYTAAAL